MNRWLIAGMGTLLQLCLGSVYAWSYFQKPLVDAYGWRNTQVAWTFIQAGRADHIIAHPKPGQFPVQPEACGSGFVTTDDLFGQGLLLLDPRQEDSWVERLRRLRFGPVQHAHHHNARRMDIQRQLELRVKVKVSPRIMTYWA